jgi:hypothetical protein
LTLGNGALRAAGEETHAKRGELGGEGGIGHGFQRRIAAETGDPRGGHGGSGGQGEDHRPGFRRGVFGEIIRERRCHPFPSSLPESHQTLSAGVEAKEN